MIYYTYDFAQPIFALLIYSKNEADEKRTLSNLAAEIKRAAKPRSGKRVERK